MSLSLIFAENSLIAELYEYFSNKYFSLEMPLLDNFTIEARTVSTIRMMILGITVGIIIAAAASVYNKRHLGSLIRTMIEKDCMSPDKAMTLEELGHHKSIGIKNAVKSGGTLWRWARCREEDEFFAEMAKKREEFEKLHEGEAKPPKFKELGFKRDCKTMHFYLPEEKKYAAEIKFDKKGFKWSGVVIVGIFAIILAVFLCYMLPDVIKYLDNFITVISR